MFASEIKTYSNPIYMSVCQRGDECQGYSTNIITKTFMKKKQNKQAKIKMWITKGKPVINHCSILDMAGKHSNTNHTCLKTDDNSV